QDGGDPALDRAGWTAELRLADGQRAWGWSTPGGARLTVEADGRITGFTGKVDGGQGNRAALTRLIAAELGTATSAVRLVMGDTESSPSALGTFGSRSMPDAGHALRLLAPAAGAGRGGDRSEAFPVRPDRGRDVARHGPAATEPWRGAARGGFERGPPAAGRGRCRGGRPRGGRRTVPRIGERRHAVAAGAV